MTYNNRGLAGQPILPYPDFQSYIGQDVYATISFLDATKTLVQPLTVSYRIDDLTNSQNIAQPTSVTVGLAPNMRYKIPAAQMSIPYAWEGSIIVQISWTFTAADSIDGTTFTGQCVNIIELINIQVPG